MNLSEFCIKRPVFATVLSLILIVIGIFGFCSLTTRFFPKFAQNSVMISTSYPGASAKLVETSITTPLEQAVSGLQGIDTITSTSSQGSSIISIKLKPGVNADVVANKVRNKIAIASYQLPGNLKPPLVQAGWGSMELMDIGFESNAHSLRSLRDYLQRFVINKIQHIQGIAKVSVEGANQYAMRIALDPQKMNALGASVSDIETAIQASNIALPAGTIKGNTIDYPITANTKLKTAKQFGNIVIKKIGNDLIRLNDVSQVTLGSSNATREIVRINGQPGVVLAVYNATDANPIMAAATIDKLLQHLKAQLPADIKIVHSFNQAVYMKASVHEVYQAIMAAIICVALVIFIFLGRIRTLLIPLVTIPICLISAFGLMYLLGFTINVITLLAVVLSIGLVVDDAIVMLENIYRHIESGLKPFVAAIQGSREITFAVIAMTLTLAAVYAPAGLVKGQAANIFRSFAFTLAGTVLISGFVALTLSPMMCARILPQQSSKPSRYQSYLEAGLSKLTQLYQRLLNAILQHRIWVVITVILLAIGGYFLFGALPKAFMPQEDMGFVITILNTPNGANLTYTQKQIHEVTDLIAQSTAVKNTLSYASASTGNGFNALFTTLKPYQQRTQSAQQLAALFNHKTHTIPGLNAASFAPSFGGSMQHQVAFSIMGSGSYLDLYHLSTRLIKALKTYPGLRDVRSNMNFDSQQYKLTVKRNIANELQVSVSNIDNAIATLLGGKIISHFSMGGKNYDVYMQAQNKDLHSLSAINQFDVKNIDGKLIPLSNLVNITPTLTQPVLPHYDQLRSATVSAQLAPGYKLGTVVTYLTKQLPQLLPNNTQYAFTGMAKQLQQSSSSLGMIFILALIFIYLVLSAQFESFLDPLIILLAVPLSIVGAMASLKAIHGSLNIYTDIGLITLIGLISKHGILITQFANTLQKQGLSASNALVQAAAVRLRPILMTTAAMIFGALPLVFATGASANSRIQIGIVIIGGLFFGTFFSLIVVPVTYSYMAQLKVKCKRRKQA